LGTRDETAGGGKKPTDLVAAYYSPASIFPTVTIGLTVRISLTGRGFVGANGLDFPAFQPSKNGHFKE
jgi:hypothetical protein